MNEAESPRGFGGREDPAPATDDDGNEIATPEEQAMYDLLSIRGRKIVFGEGKEDLLELMSTAPSPAEGIGMAVAVIMKSLVKSAEASGKDIDTGVAIAAGGEIVQDLNELAKSQGVYEYDSEDDERQEVTDAVMWGVKYYGDGMVKAGELSPEIQRQAQAEVNEGLGQEGVSRKTPIAAGVGQAMGPPGGIVGGQMQQPGGA